MQKLNDNIYYIGVNDRTTHLFESMWPLPKGVSYNSYLIDDEKVAVVDCVGQDFFEEYLQNIREVIADRKIDTWNPTIREHCSCSDNSIPTQK